ncbi:MAG: FAD-dependent oxidoreductase [Deinococcales bacterium]
MNRQQQLTALKEQHFDILVIGGGATGTGIALDAATRGLKVALVERDDFSAATSSRSTKLIHGGVRYLEQAVWRLDRGQFNLVRDALKERAILLNIAPHLAKPLALLTPLYKWWQVPYYRIGLIMYDALAGKANLKASRFIRAKEALERFPMLKKEGFYGGVVYYDGQFDDARMNVSLALTAVSEGACVANHVEVTALLKEQGRLTGARVIDRLTGEAWEIQAKVIINATGPFSDAIRHLDEPEAKNMLSASSGIHIVLDRSFSPPETGLLIPETEDGRVLFLLPWLGHTIVGTTDNPATIEAHPKADEADIDYVLRHVRKYFAVPVNHQDIKATFSGLRPLVSDPKAHDTAKLSRDHVINVSTSGLLTIAGGKWTTYRKMALDAVNEAIRLGSLSPKGPSKTEQLKLIGAKHFDSAALNKLIEECALAEDIALHLHQAYGDQAARVLTYGEAKRLHPDHPYLEAEVSYAALHESACDVIDVLARRMRLGFVDEKATLAVIPKVAELLTKALHWTEAFKLEQVRSAKRYFAH